MQTRKFASNEKKGLLEEFEDKLKKWHDEKAEDEAVLRRAKVSSYAFTPYTSIQSFLVGMRINGVLLLRLVSIVSG